MKSLPIAQPYSGAFHIYTTFHNNDGNTAFVGYKDVMEMSTSIVYSEREKYTKLSVESER